MDESCNHRASLCSLFSNPIIIRQFYKRLQIQSHCSPLTPRTPAASPNFVTSYPEPLFPPHLGQARPARIDPISLPKEFNPRTCSQRWQYPGEPPQYVSLAPTAISSHPSISSFSSLPYPILSHQSLLSTLHFPTPFPLRTHSPLLSLR